MYFLFLRGRNHTEEIKLSNLLEGGNKRKRKVFLVSSVETLCIYIYIYTSSLSDV